jgi:hypothetical protein
VPHYVLPPGKTKSTLGTLGTQADRRSGIPSFPAGEHDSKNGSCVSCELVIFFKPQALAEIDDFTILVMCGDALSNGGMEGIPAALGDAS